MPSSSIRRAATSLAACFAALLLALCVGAIWSVASVILDRDTSFMVVPAIYVARFGVSHLPLQAPATRAFAAALLVALSTAYALYLHAASLITAQLGVSFGESIMTTGPTLAWMLVSARTPPVASIVLAVAPLVAALVVFVESRRDARAPQSSMAR